jgi:hypothetical protein
VQIAVEVSRGDMETLGVFADINKFVDAVCNCLLPSLVEIACFRLDLKVQQQESAGLISAEWVRRVGRCFKQSREVISENFG